MRDRRTTFNKLESEGCITRQQHFRLQATIIWAQLANTLPAAFWTLFWILKDPSALEAVRAELENGDSAQVMAKLQRGDVSHLPVLHCCILEAMRLATGSMTVRQVVAPCSLPSGAGEVSLRVGDRVAIFPPLMHFDESLFPDASTFKWRRFLASNGSTNEVNSLSRHVMPFGGGESLCPGRHFAKNEIAQFVAGALQAFEMRLHPSCSAHEAPKFDPTRVGLGIYPPEHDSVEMLLRRRTKV